MASTIEQCIDLFNHFLLIENEELGIRSEEWWKGRTTYKAPQYPFLYFFDKKTDRVMFHVKHDSIRFYCEYFII